MIDAINHAIDIRKRSGTIDLTGLIHHSDAGSQDTAVAFTENLADEGILPSIGTVGDSYDNALAESINSSYKNELVDNEPLYPGMAELSLATAEWVAFYNRERPNGYWRRPHPRPGRGTLLRSKTPPLKPRRQSDNGASGHAGVDQPTPTPRKNHPQISQQSPEDVLRRGPLLLLQI